MSRRILVTGAVGQIGSELTQALRERHGGSQVVAAGHHTPPGPELRDTGPFVFVDVTKRDALAAVVEQYEIGTVYHMAALLSAVGEAKPHLCWDVNVNGLYNVLEVARENDIRLFCPSSIAAFGPETPREQTPQETVLRPRTMYGVTKVAGELLCNYYLHRFGVDVRGLRYPGVISYVTPPGGGTTDYAVEICYEAVRSRSYTCFVRADTVLPMMYMPDCIKATLDLMDADPAQLQHHADYNISAMSFAARDLAEQIQQHVPGFAVHYEPDPVRQAIADSWPKSIDDSAARAEWGWQPEYDLESMTKDMLDKLASRYARGAL